VSGLREPADPEPENVPLTRKLLVSSPHVNPGEHATSCLPPAR
jgi:hypothetical protein